MRILPLLCAAALFPVPAKADKFWLGDPDKQTVQGNVPDCIEGVLTDQNDTSYHIRVVGGEVVLPKARVFKVEKDDLTLDAIVAAEQKEQERLAKESERRDLARAAERLRSDINAAEASARRSDVEKVEVPVPVPVPVAVEARRAPAFDPVIGRAIPAAPVSHYQLLEDLEMAWSLTKDRRYLTALRRLRRLH